MSKALSKPIDEAVRILSEWSSKVGATIVRPTTIPIPSLAALKGEGVVVGILRWEKSTRWWYVTCGMGYWRVSPECEFKAALMSSEIATLARTKAEWVIPPKEIFSPKIDKDQEVLI